MNNSLLIVSLDSKQMWLVVIKYFSVTQRDDVKSSDDSKLFCDTPIGDHFMFTASQHSFYVPDWTETSPSNGLREAKAMGARVHRGRPESDSRTQPPTPRTTRGSTDGAGHMPISRNLTFSPCFASGFPLFFSFFDGEFCAHVF